MKKMSAEERIAELKKTLEYHIDRYYNQDSPEISDYEYDMMMQELKNLEKSTRSLSRRILRHSVLVEQQKEKRVCLCATMFQC